MASTDTTKANVELPAAAETDGRAPRQKAVAVGPVSERRTKIPELPIASAPANRASNAVTSEALRRSCMTGKGARGVAS